MPSTGLTQPQRSRPLRLEGDLSHLLEMEPEAHRILAGYSEEQIQAFLMGFRAGTLNGLEKARAIWRA